jgi:1-acyl-sn-glycerol-3-phosphate acyltransferase
MQALEAMTLVAFVWIVLMLAIRLWAIPWLSNGPAHNPLTGLLWRLLHVYGRVLHRATYVGFEALRSRIDAGPLIVVSNHTGAVDPLLLQAACKFHIRWMMASEMMLPGLDWLWRHQKAIPVDRDGRDSGPAREAIRHVQAGGVIGIFPEGRIVAPPREIRPFATGVGLVVARTRAPVLLVWVRGTPDTRDTIRSLITPSHARVTFVELIDFAGEKDGHIIASRLRQRLAEVSGWPLNDELMPRSQELERLMKEF